RSVWARGAGWVFRKEAPVGVVGMGPPPAARLVFVLAQGARRARVPRAFGEWSAGGAGGPGRARQQCHRQRRRNSVRKNVSHDSLPWTCSCRSHCSVSGILLGLPEGGGAAPPPPPPELGFAACPLFYV